MTRPIAVLLVFAWLLWAYDMPSPEWLVIGASDTREACERRKAAVTQAQSMLPPVGLFWQQRCLPVGLDPERVHPTLYDWLQSWPETAPR